MAALCLLRAGAQTADYTPTKENLQARETFRSDRFGIFIHWGLYTMAGDGEWMMHNRNVDRDEYARLAGGFYPAAFDADRWVKAVADAGAKYICVTTRHHDGFSMFATGESDFNIIEATPFRRDVIRELADACARHGIRLHLYYSHLDWRRDDYFPRGRTGLGTGRTREGRWDDYCAFMNRQLTELLTGYGPIGAIWFDGMWDKDIYPDGVTDSTWRLTPQYALIHRLQPSCLIANNHHTTPFAGEDIQIFERDLPGENKAGLSGQAISRLPLETCETMNRSWGYRMTDQAYKSTADLIRLLVRAAGNDANLLLNVGPQPDGQLPDTALARLREVGAWMKTYGKTVQGTRGGVVRPHEWGVTTQRGRTLFVHVLSDVDRLICLPYAGNRVRQAVDYRTRVPVRFVQDADGIVLKLPTTAKADPDFVVEVEFGNELPSDK